MCRAVLLRFAAEELAAVCIRIVSINRIRDRSRYASEIATGAILGIVAVPVAEADDDEDGTNNAYS